MEEAEPLPLYNYTSRPTAVGGENVTLFSLLLPHQTPSEAWRPQP